jgi:hypothetical protein
MSKSKTQTHFTATWFKDRSMTLNIGIIGAGQAGERHAVGFGHVPSTQVVGIADLVLPRAEALASKFGATAVDDWRRLFDLDIDVLVCPFLAQGGRQSIAESRERVAQSGSICRSLWRGRAPHSGKVSAGGARGIEKACRWAIRIQEKLGTQGCGIRGTPNQEWTQ